MKNELSAALDSGYHIDNATEMKAPLPVPYFSTIGRYAATAHLSNPEWGR